MNAEKLKVILEKHKLWLEGDSSGERANLRGADLRGADLERADLRGANLQRANLRGCAGNRLHIKSLFISNVYPITYTGTHMQIGCKRYTFAEWWGFTDEEILKMDGRIALKFWREYKEFLRMTVEKFPAEPTHPEGSEQ